MANLTRRFTWKKWAPDIGENRELPEPVLYLELATGLTGEQMEAIKTGLRSARGVKLVLPVEPTKEELEAGAAPVPAEAYTAAGKAWLAAVRAVYVETFAPFVRVHGGPHTVDGQALATLDDYLRLTEECADLGVAARRELEAAVSRFNSVSGPDELFSLRSSGGARSTDAQSTAKGGSPTASP